MSKKSGTLGEVIVGLFMIAVIGLMAYFTIVISGVDIIRGDNKLNMRIVFSEVGGLKDHDNVMYRGTKVGKIEEVEISPSNLVVTASVNKNTILREGYEISVCNLSMIGGNYLLLEEGKGEVLDLEETLFVGQTPVDWMRDVTKIASNLREVTEMSEIKVVASNIVSVTEKANTFMDKANSAADEARLTIAEAREFLAGANKVADSVESAVAEAKMFLEHATVAVDSVDTTAKDISVASKDISVTAQDISVTAKDFSTLAKDLDSAALKADSILGAVDGKKDDLIAELEAGIVAFRKSAESFNATEMMSAATDLAKNLDELSLRLKNGEGSLGKLMADSTLYDEVQGMVRDARQVLDNYRDTTPITTFSSLATGAL